MPPQAGMRVGVAPLEAADRVGLDVRHHQRRAPRRLAHRLEVAERAVVEGDAQVAVGVELAAGEVRLAGSDRIGHLEEVEVRRVRTQGVDGVGRAFVDEDFVAARGLQRRATLAQRVGAAQRAERVDHVLDQLPPGSRGHLEPGEVGVKRPRPPGTGGNLGRGGGQHRPAERARVVEERRRHLALAVAVRQSERLAQHRLGGPAAERARASEADDARRDAARVVPEPAQDAIELRPEHHLGGELRMHGAAHGRAVGHADVVQAGEEHAVGLHPAEPVRRAGGDQPSVRGVEHLQEHQRHVAGVHDAVVGIERDMPARRLEEARVREHGGKARLLVDAGAPGLLDHPPDLGGKEGVERRGPAVARRARPCGRACGPEGGLAHGLHPARASRTRQRRAKVVYP